jgi:hypothetical protein
MAIQTARVEMTNGGFFAAMDEEGTFRIFDLERGTLRMGETIEADFESKGDTVATNKTSGEKLTVKIDAARSSKQGAIDRLCHLNPGGNLLIAGEEESDERYPFRGPDKSILGIAINRVSVSPAMS